LRNAVLKVIIISAALFCVKEAQAQNANGPSALSDSERSAIGSILDNLATKAGPDLEQRVILDIDKLGGAKSAETVVSAVKLGAGAKLKIFESILIGKCMAAGGASYCKLAALQPPNAKSNSIKTAASSNGGDGGGGEAGGGFGGGAQTNFNHSSSRASSEPAYFSGNTPSDQNFAAFNARFGTYAYASVSGRSNSVGGGAQGIVTVPGPQVGTGLPFVGIAGVLAWYLGRQQRRRIGR
jgi:hypothetical protein